MFKSIIVAAAIVAAFAVTPVAAAEWSLGSHLELATLQSDVRGSGSSTLVTWPSNTFGYQPGLRVAVGDTRHANELTLDSGLFAIDEAGSSLTLFSAFAAWQHAFRAANANAPFANIGMGLYREGGAAYAATAASYGAGIGMRHRIHDGRGDVRAEVRVDHLRGVKRLDRPELTSIGLRLGFDLWI